MHQRLGVVHLDGHTGGGQQFAVADPVVAQRIVPGDGDVGGRQIGQVLGPTRRHARRGIGQVDVARVPAGECGDGRAVQDGRVGVLG